MKLKTNKLERNAWSDSKLEHEKKFDPDIQPFFTLVNQYLAQTVITLKTTFIYCSTKLFIYKNSVGIFIITTI